MLKIMGRSRLIVNLMTLAIAAVAVAAAAAAAAATAAATAAAASAAEVILDSAMMIWALVMKAT